MVWKDLRFSKKGKGEKIWLYGIALFVIGIVMLFGSMALGLPEGTQAQTPAQTSHKP